MNIISIINKKRMGLELTKKEIHYFIEAYVQDEIEDYQVSSLLMAICCNGMSKVETAEMTRAMIQSGETIDLSEVMKPTVDKHSTGGVGDKTSLILAPILAVFGVAVAKMSGRGLGFTGGTLDKLESLPSFDINLTEKEFINQLNEHGLSIIGQTKELVPADKKIYQLRDVTGTVSSIPLIAASIMSKKIASGANNIMLDIKCGPGAFMKTEEEAKELALELISIGESNGKKIKATISTMEQPLGYAVGNINEILEVVDTLNGNGPKDLEYLCVTLTKEILKMINIEITKEEIMSKLFDGSAYQKFIDMLIAQGSSEKELLSLEMSACEYQFISKTAGYVKSYQTDKVGLAAMYLGAGRVEKKDIINHEVGINVKFKIGDYVDVGDTLFNIYYSNKETLIKAINELENSIIIDENKTKKIDIIKEII